MLFDLKQRVYIIAEAGSNWRGGTPERDQEMARSLIAVAAASGADAIKFQTYRPESVYVRNAGESGYLAGAGIKKSIYDIFADLAMPYEMLEGLADYCRQQGIAFMSTPFSVADAEAVDPFVDVHKVASYEINHVRLLQWLAKTGKPLILSSGAADQNDIAFALETLYAAGAADVVLMQCTARYPAPLESLNLKAIMQLQERFQVPVGFSDHSRDPIVAPVAAVALGARVIEKHFTLHNRLPGPDHIFALCPDELVRMVSAIRDAEKTLGSGEKEVHADEQELREFAVRSLQAMRNIQIGEILQEGVNFDVLRSGQCSKGLHPKYLRQVQGTRAKVSIAAGQGIRKDDLDGCEC